MSSVGAAGLICRHPTSESFIISLDGYGDAEGWPGDWRLEVVGRRTFDGRLQPLEYTATVLDQPPVAGQTGNEDVISGCAPEPIATRASPTSRNATAGCVVANHPRNQTCATYPQAVQLSVRGFLIARFVAMVCWVLLLVAGYITYSTLAPHIGSDFVRWVVSLTTQVASIWLGYVVQRRALLCLDPDGEIRRQLREQSEATRRQS
jgi:hypothetical protein